MSGDISPEKLKRVPLKEELVKLTGCFIKALILQQFLYWSERVHDFDAFIAEEKLRNPDLEIELRYGWIYKSAKQLHTEVMFGDSLSPQTLKRRLEEIVEAGYLDSRHNPEHGWDRCLQYRPNILKIQIGLQSMGYGLEGYSLAMEENAFLTVRNAFNTEKNQFATVINPIYHSEKAIPETTTETTTEFKRKGIKINFDLPPYNHYDLVNKWVYLRQGEDLVKAFVSDATPKRLRLIIEKTDGLKLYDPTNRVFYQNGNSDLVSVVIGEDLKADREKNLSSEQLAMKRRLVDLTHAGEILVKTERNRTIGKLQEAARFMVKRGDTPGDVDKFERWFRDIHWRGRDGETVTLQVLSKLWPQFREGVRDESTSTRSKESSISSLSGRAIDEPIKEIFDPKTKETYYVDRRTNERVPEPAGSAIQ